MSDNQVIPEAAVDAAVDALVASRLGDHKGINGEEFVEAARLALEAAAPYITREAQEIAWAKGVTSAGINLMALQVAGINPNPYRIEP